MEERLDALEKKYFDLVWLARTGLEDEGRPDVSTQIKRIRLSYPEEVQDLEDDENNWHHGFNSGMLAACRLFMSYVDDDSEEIQQAEEEFPFLDT